MKSEIIPELPPEQWHSEFTIHQNGRLVGLPTDIAEWLGISQSALCRAMNCGKIRRWGMRLLDVADAKAACGTRLRVGRPSRAILQARRNGKAI